MKKCLKCKATYKGHGGLRCSIDRQNTEHKKKCAVIDHFKEEKAKFDRAGWILGMTRKSDGLIYGSGQMYREKFG